MAGLKYIDNQTWRYENAGTSTDLLVSSYTRNNLPATISRTGSAFTLDTFGITDKTFGLPSTNEIWIKFDVYSGNAWGWRIGNSDDINGVCNIGTSTAVNTVVSFYANDSHVSQFYYIRKTATLQTYLLHMKSGISDGIIEAWCDGTKISTYVGNVNNGNSFNNIYLQSDVYTDNYFSNVIISNAEIGLDEIITGFVIYSIDIKRIVNNFPWHFDILFAVRCNIHNSVDWSDEYSIVPDARKFTIPLLEGQSEFWIKFDIYLPQVLSTGNTLNSCDFYLYFNDVIILELSLQDASNSVTQSHWGTSSDFCMFFPGFFYDTIHSEFFPNISAYILEDTGRYYLPLGNQTILIHYICGTNGILEIWFGGIKLSPTIYCDTTDNNALSFENIKSFTMKSWRGYDACAESPNISNLVVSTNSVDLNYKVTSNKCAYMFVDVERIIRNESISQPIAWRYENVGEKDASSIVISDVPFNISHTGYAILDAYRHQYTHYIGLRNINSTSLWFKFDFSIVNPINVDYYVMRYPFEIRFKYVDNYLVIFCSEIYPEIYIMPEDIVLNDRESNAIYIFVPSVFNVVHTIMIHSTYKFTEMWFDGKQIISDYYYKFQSTKQLELKIVMPSLDKLLYLSDYISNQESYTYQYGSNMNIDSDLHFVPLFSNIILSNIPIGLQENARSLSEVNNALLTLYQFILDVSSIVENNHFSQFIIIDVCRILIKSYFLYSFSFDINTIIENNYFRYCVNMDVSRRIDNNNFIFDIKLFVLNKTTLSLDIKRKVYDIIWRYENVGRADLLAIDGNTVSNLPVTQSRTGTAFWQKQRIATFPIPATKELWVKFDIYYTGTNRWRAYDRLNGNDTGIGRFTNTTTLICYINGPDSYDVNPKQALTTETLHTVLLHMVSDSANGLVEAWLDGVKCYSDDFASDGVIYKGNVESGADFENFYIQSEDKTNLFSNVIISNVPIDLDDNVRELFNQYVESVIDVNLVIVNENFASESEVFDVEYIIVIPCSFSFDVKRVVLIPHLFFIDVARISGGRFLKFYDVQRVINVSFDVKRVVLIPHLFFVDVKRVVLIPHLFFVDVKRVVLIPHLFFVDVGILIINLISLNVDIKRTLSNDNFFDVIAYFDVIVQLDICLFIYLDIRRQLQNETILSLFKAYLPFDNSPTEDLCGNTWTAVENPVVQDSKLVLDGSSYIRTTEFTLGGRDFTICGWCYTDVNCAVGARVFSIHLTPDTGNVLVQLRHPTQNNTSGWRLLTNTKSNVNSTSMNTQDSGVIPFGRFHHFEVVYCYTVKTMTFFVDGIQKAQYKNCPQFTSQAFVVDLGLQYYSSSEIYLFTGTVDNFAIYDGIALHTSNFDTIEHTHSGIALSNHSPLMINFDVSRYINIGFVSSYFDLFRTIFRNIISYVVDIKRRIKWRYENAGNADDLILDAIILTDLPITQSKTSVAFYQTTRAKCFDLPATDEIWIKFDVYFDGTNRWRAYNGGANGTTGITAQDSGGLLSLFANDTSLQNTENICKTNQLQTVLLHMHSSTAAGIIEAWIDGQFVYSYTGDVNHGEDFADIYLQSDGAGTFFSNVIISNAEITLGEGYCKKTFDTVRFVETREHIVSILSSMKVWLPFDNSPTEDLCGNTWTAYGSPTIENGTLKTNGVDQYLEWADMPPVNELFNSDFTIHFYMTYRDSKTSEGGFFTTYPKSFSWQCYSSKARFNANCTINGKNQWLAIDSANLSEFKNSEHHFAITRKDDTLYFFLDGTLKKTYTVGTFYDTDTTLHIARRSNYRTALNMRDFCIHTEALWTENFVSLPNEYYKLLQKYKIVIGDVQRIVLQPVFEFYDVSRMIIFLYDVNRVICLSYSFSFDIRRYVYPMDLISALKAYLPFDNSPTEDLCGNSWTASGNVSLVTEIQKFASSVHLPSGAYLEAANIVDLSAEKWTFDCWCYRVSSSGSKGFFGIGDGGTGYRGIIVSNDGIYVDIASGSGWQASTKLLFPSVTSVWKHLAVVKNGTSLKFFEDGIIVWSATVNDTPRSTSRLILGANSYGNSNDLYFDEVRFYDGEALWTENFTPPTAQDYNELQFSLGSSIIIFFDCKRVIHWSRLPIEGYISFTGNTGCYGELPLEVLAGATTFTIEAKFSTTSTKNNSYNWRWGTIAGREIGGNWKDDFGFCVNDGKLCFWAEPKSGGSDSTKNTTSNATVNDGQIHKVAVVSSGGAIDLYCDGVKVAHKDNVNAKISASQTILLAYDSNPNSYLQMDLYEARFWNVARTQEQIFADIDGSETGLQAWYLSEYRVNNIIPDQSGHERDVILYGSPDNTLIFDLQTNVIIDIEIKISNSVVILLDVQIFFVKNIIETFDTIILLSNSVIVYYDLVRIINNSTISYAVYYDIKLNLTISLQIYCDIFVMLSNIRISYYDVNVNVLLSVEVYYDVICGILNQYKYYFDIVCNIIVPIILPDSGNIKYTLSRLRIYSEPQKFILPETSKFYIYGDLAGKVNVYSDTNMNRVASGSYYFEQHSLKIDFEESNVFYISLNTQVMSPQDVVKLFIRKLNTSNLVGKLSLNRAVIYATDGKYVSWDNFINHFLTCLNSVGYNRFLDFYCDIILDNDDTGAITGWDAGGLVVKTADSIVTESVPIDQWVSPEPGSSVIIDKLRVHFPETGYNGSLTNNEKYILSGLNSEWIYRSLELVQYSLGIFFDESDPLYDMYVEFFYDSSSGETANVSYENQNGVKSLVLAINMYHYNSINVTDVNGEVQYNDIYLDRTISHEFAHALMALKNDNYGYLPEYIIEGLSELIHGIDDDRYDNIVSLLTTRKNDLISALVDESYVYESDKYTAGYILLRFLAKQGQHIKTNSAYDRLIINNLIITNNLSLVVTTVYYDVKCILFHSIYLALDINIILNNHIDIVYDVLISAYISFIFNCDVVRNIVVTFTFYMIVSVCRIIKQYQLIIVDVLRKIKENYNNCVMFNVAIYGVKNSHINSVVFNTALYGVTYDINDIVPTFNVDSSKTRTKIHQFIKPIIMLLIKPIDNDMIIDHVSSLALRSTPLYPDRSNKGYNVRG